MKERQKADSDKQNRAAVESSENVDILGDGDDRDVIF